MVSLLCIRLVHLFYLRIVLIFYTSRSAVLFFERSIEHSITALFATDSLRILFPWIH